MLVLTRKVGQRIVIGENIVISVADIRGDSVRLAIEAPTDVKIYRGEIHDAVVSENIQAAQSAPLSGLERLSEMKKQKK